MLRYADKALVVAALLLLAGCTHGTISVGNMNGVAYVIEGSSMGVDDRSVEVRLYNERATLRVREGRLLREDDDMGEVRPGDHVRLASDGRVFVNGRERLAARGS